MTTPPKKFEPWITLSNTLEIDTPWLQVHHNRYQLPSGKRGDYHFVRTPGSVIIVPVLADGRIVLIRQYRYLLNQVMLELPCGGIRGSQTALAAAQAELREETGFVSAHIEQVGAIFPYKGISDELCTIFVAAQLTQSTPAPEATEQIEVLYLHPSQVDAHIFSGQLQDGMSISAWHLARPHLFITTDSAEA